MNPSHILLKPYDYNQVPLSAIPHANILVPPFNIAHADTTLSDISHDINQPCAIQHFNTLAAPLSKLHTDITPSDISHDINLLFAIHHACKEEPPFAIHYVNKLVPPFNHITYIKKIWYDCQ